MSFASDNFEFDLGAGGGGIGAGIYEVECVSWEKSQTKAHRESGATDDNCIIMGVLVTHDEHGAPVDEPEEIKEWLMWSRKAIWKLEQVLEAFGIAKPGQKVKFSTSDMIGKRCLVALEMGTYNGRSRLQIGEYRAHPAGPVRQPTEGPAKNEPAGGDIPF